MDMKLVLLRLERLSHLKIAAGVASNHSEQLHLPRLHQPHPLPHFGQRHCLVFYECVVVFVSCSCANFLWLEENNPQVAGGTLVCVWQCQLGRLQAAKCTCPPFLGTVPTPGLPSDCFSVPFPFPHTCSFSFSHEYIMPCT